MGRTQSTPHTFEANIAAEKAWLEQQLARTAFGPERDHILRKIRQFDTARHLNDWLMSPGLRPPSEKINMSDGVPSCDRLRSHITARLLASIGDGECACSRLNYRSSTMSNYRAYIVAEDGHFENFEVVAAESDDKAVEEARKLVDGHDVEVWHLARKIAVLKHDEN